MATKKTENNDVVKAYDPDELVEIFIPIDYTNPDEMTFYLGHNGIGIRVPRGETVKVKRKFADVWKDTQAEMDAQLKRAAAGRAKAAQYTQNYIINTTE